MTAGDIRYGRRGGGWLPKEAVNAEPAGWTPPSGLTDTELRDLFRYRNELCSRCHHGFEDTGPLVVPYWARGTEREAEQLLCRDCCHVVADIHEQAGSWPTVNHTLNGAA